MAYARNSCREGWYGPHRAILEYNPFMAHPLASVIMPIYNSERFLRPAIESVLAQDMTDHEFLIIDDHSTDQSQMIIAEYQARDQRIQLVQNIYERCPAGAMNTGLELARGRYIIRVDSDDICLPQRFSKQITFMEKNESCGISGSAVIPVVDAEGRQIDILKFPEDPSDIHAGLLFTFTILQPALIMRSSLLKQHALCYAALDRAEDYELFIRSARYFPLMNLPDPVIHYRKAGIKERYREASRYFISGILEPGQDVARLLREFQPIFNANRSLLHEIGVALDEQRFIVHSFCCAASLGMSFPLSREILQQIEEWLELIRSGNEKKKIFRSEALERIIQQVWKKCERMLLVRSFHDRP